MMYCEFIDISEYGENYITFTEYHDYIEPIYMDADMSKQDCSVTERDHTPDGKSGCRKSYS